jgi:hypothetical protein
MCPSSFKSEVGAELILENLNSNFNVSHYYKKNNSKLFRNRGV